MHTMKKLSSLILSGIFGGVVVGVMLYMPSIVNASTEPLIVAGYQDSLASKVASTDTSMTLVRGTDSQGRNLSGYYGITLDEGTASQEFVVCTANGTALTGCTRGLDIITATTSVSTNQTSHSRGATVKITNYPFDGWLANIFAGKDMLPTPLLYTSHPCNVSSSAYTICDKNYIDNQVAAGGVPGSNSVAGIFLLATKLQSASSTDTALYNSVSYKLVLAASTATDTPNTNTRASVIPMTKLDGYLDQSWLNYGLNYTWSGKVVHNATTTIAASSTTGNPLTLNTVPYAFPGSNPTASSSALENDANGNLSWLPISKLLDASTTPTDVAGTASTTMYNFLVPANTLGKNGIIWVHMTLAPNLVTGGTEELELAYGNATTSIAQSQSTGSSVSTQGTLDFYIMANGATNSQRIITQLLTMGNGAITTSPKSNNFSNSVSASVDSTQAQMILIRGIRSDGTTFNPYNVQTLLLNR